MSDLKACPFCGGSARVAISPANTSGPEQAHVECASCGVANKRVWADPPSTDRDEPKPVSVARAVEQATEAWNRRVAQVDEPLTEDEARDVRSIAEALRSGPWDEADLHARHGAALEKALRMLEAQAAVIERLRAVAFDEQASPRNRLVRLREALARIKLPSSLQRN